ncbi:hypothetical protein O6P43_010066 [Quillaja saponaria]|uniref:Uncharacterized protein n=1 Tax=Quillaja saponaria TaxID=32244 RepID=A0AAD7PZM6_QUISA|nr:hypothetical protein O6P43_010066 [Quillaja saponaria]
MCDIFNTPKWKSLSESASKNRLANDEVVHHFGGSRPAPVHAEHMMSQFGRPVSDVKVFNKLHMKDGQYVDARFQKQAVAYVKKQPSSGQPSSSQHTRPSAPSLISPSQLLPPAQWIEQDRLVMQQFATYFATHAFQTPQSNDLHTSSSANVNSQSEEPDDDDDAHLDDT